ncbi:MAG: sorbosone dehydrogenase family protein [bacterium]|nr:sorbosone dehydrogenase family protein [bacterium]
MRTLFRSRRFSTSASVRTRSGVQVLKRLGIASVLLTCLAIGACSLLPTINAPVLQIFLWGGVDAPEAATVNERMRAPAGYTVKVFAEGLPNVRELLFTPSGDLIAAQAREGKVASIAPDRDGDGRSDGVAILMSGLNGPNGLALRDGWLYVAESDAIGKIRFDVAAAETRGELDRFITGIPGAGNHWTRGLGFGPDGGLYVSVGSSCNVCEEADPRRAAILRYEPDGSNEQIYASGLRNAVDFDWQPGTGRMFATDNGRDLLGDDFPPCELNEVKRGGHYGWPFANGDKIPDPDFGSDNQARIDASISPAFPFRAHNAPLGISFIRGTGEYQNAALVALHGSWNRTKKDGYKVVSLHWDADGKIEQRDFLVGFEKDEDVIGRPADVIEGPDGSFYISDDYAGAIYRVSRR